MSEFLPFHDAPHDHDIWGGKAPEQSRLEWATVGWDDKDDWFDVNTDESDGVTLVRVQTYAGRVRGEPITPGVAAGHQYLAQIAGPMWRIPRKGERCILAIPSGMEETAGAAVILAFFGKAPSDQYSKTRAKLDYGEDYDLVIKARSITISDYDNRFLAIGPDSGIVVQDKDGSGVIVKDGAIAIFTSDGSAMKSLVQLTNDDINLCVLGGSLLQLDASKATLFGLSVYCQGGGVYLGAAPTALTTALHGATGIAGVASTSVFISP